MRTAARSGLAIYVVVMLLLFVSTLIAAEPSIAAPPASTSFRDKGAAKLSQSIRTKYPLIQAVLVLRGDLPVFEYYRKGAEPNDLLPANSVTKSVMSTLIGIALGQGSFSSLDQGLGELLPEVFEAGVDTRVREITIRHLLTMTSGFNQTASIGAVSPSGLLWAWSLHRPLLDAPGRRFNYDNEASHLLSVLLTRAIKQDPTRFARQYLFEPLGIENNNWPLDGDGNLGGSVGLFLTARDMAKIGTLWLRGGKWHGRQLVPKSYIAQAIQPHNQGPPLLRASYGYLWWVTRPPGEAAAYFAQGARGQYIYVVPAADIVIAIAADELLASGRVLINQVILPAMQVRNAH